jgi:hypothetical protein
MTAKEKAIELVGKMKLATDEFGYININKERHKQCALIAVDEILEVLGEEGVYLYADSKFEIYYKEVKQEIKKL